MWLAQRMIVRASQVLYIGGSIAIAFLAVLVAYSAISRYFFNQAVFFMEELAGLLLLACAFSSFAYIFVKGEHIKVSLLTSRLPLKARYWLEGVTGTIALFFLSVLFKESLGFTYKSYLLNCHSNDANLYEVPWMGLMPVGTLMLILVVLVFCIERGFKACTTPKIEKAGE